MVNIYLVEAVENVLHMFGWHAYTCVGYLQANRGLTVFIE